MIKEWIVARGRCNIDFWFSVSWNQSASRNSRTASGRIWTRDLAINKWAFYHCVTVSSSIPIVTNGRLLFTYYSNCSNNKSAINPLCIINRQIFCCWNKQSDFKQISANWLPIKWTGEILQRNHVCQLHVFSSNRCKISIIFILMYRFCYWSIYGFYSNQSH